MLLRWRLHAVRMWLMAGMMLGEMRREMRMMLHGRRVPLFVRDHVAILLVGSGRLANRC